MRFLTVLIIIMLICCVNLISAQTVADIEKKYGKAVAFQVSEYFWMKPEFSADGQICRATLFYNQLPTYDDFSNQKIQTPPLRQLIEVFSKLAPLETRGAKKDYFGTTNTQSSVAWTTFEYEKVTFTFLVYFKLFGSLAEMQERGVPLGGRTPAKSNKSDDDFMIENAINPDRVEIKWGNRTCTEK